MNEGLIIKSISNKYTVEVNSRTYLCNARGNVKKDIQNLSVGDRVVISNLDINEATIEKVLPRFNKFIRPNIANINQMIIIIAIKDPIPDLLVLDKQIIYCLYNNCIPIICINKIDINRNKAEEIAKIYRDVGYKVYLTSVKEDIGINDIRNIIKEKITAFSGNSGVGKSSLLNAIFNENKNEIGSISDKLKRGKHTTKYTQLFKSDENTYIADTPGFSRLDILVDIKAEDLKNYYEEFEHGKCEYMDCIHVDDSGCYIKKMIANRRNKQNKI